MAIKPLQSITLKNEGGEDTTYVVASAPAIVETTEPADVASFSDGAEGIPVTSLIADINPVQTGSGDPSPSNVRPITGWTGMNVVRTGKNLFGYSLPIHKGYWSSTSFVGDDSVVPLENATGWTNIRVCVPEGATITISGMQAASGVYAAWLGSDDPTDVVSRFSNYSMNGTKTVPSGAKYLGLCFNELSTAYTDYPNAQIVIGSTATTYEPYNGTTYPISWADEAGTVYGGTLDVTTGLLTVTHYYWTENGTANWTKNADGSFFARYSSPLSTQAAGSVGWCNYCPYALTFNGVNMFARANNLMNLGKGWGDLYANTDALKAAFAATPLEVVYPLATPQTYQLTPQAVTTILGQNNIWADTGDVEVAYCADTKMYIDKVIAAL